MQPEDDNARWILSDLQPQNSKSSATGLMNEGLTVMLNIEQVNNYDAQHFQLYVDFRRVEP